MKTIVALLLAASLTACGSKAKSSTTPDTTDTTGTTDTQPTDGTGGTTYGGETPPAPEGAAPEGAE